MRAWFLVLLVACSNSSSPSPEPQAFKPKVADVAKAGDMPAFGLYVLALSWAPDFCCGHPDKDECSGLDTAFAGSHLSLHGLWPNFTDAETGGKRSYPQFCGDYARCAKGHDKTCEPDPSTIPDEMKTVGPGYIGDHDFLADHEWPKHGSCTGMTSAAYFRAAIDAMKALPGEGTPAAMTKAIGGDIAIADLQGAFGVPKESVLLSCDASCQLEQVSFCLAHDAKNVPTTPMACPANTTAAQYDNGCVTRKCDRVAIKKVGACSTSTTGSGATTNTGSGGGKCTKPGQGPACTGDASCKTAGFDRCARSGCCTSQPH